MNNKVCVVGSLSSIFTHSYVISLINVGKKVCVINTSKKNVYESFHGCEVLNLYNDSGININYKSKSFLKKNLIACYFYEIILFFKSYFSNIKVINDFIHNVDPDVFIFFWGTAVRKEFYSVFNYYKRKSIKKKFILDVATYPVRDYISNNSYFELAFFDRMYFSCFDKVLSHSLVMDEFLINKLNINPSKIERFICSFPRLSYLTDPVLTTSNKINNVIFLGVIDESSAINNINDDVFLLANNGINVYIQESKINPVIHPNVHYFSPFSFEQILSGDLSKFCSNFDAVLVAYGDMSYLREKLTYPTRYALADLLPISILIKKDRFISLSEIINKSDKEIIYYDNISDVVNYTKPKTTWQATDADAMENKILPVVNEW